MGNATSGLPGVQGLALVWGAGPRPKVNAGELGLGGSPADGQAVKAKVGENGAGAGLMQLAGEEGNPDASAGR